VRLRYSPHSPAWLRGSLASLRSGMTLQKAPAEENTGIEPAVLFYIEWISQSLSLIFDVGAHQGKFTRSVLEVVPKQVKMVLFEADERHVALLEALKASYSSILQILPNAVYHTSGKKLQFQQCPGEASHLLVDRKKVDGMQLVEVTTVALDDFIAAKNLLPDLIKIDAEGSEHDIILGAKNYLQSQRVPVIFEDNDLRAALLMQQLGYTIINTATACVFDPAQGNPSQATFNFFSYHPSRVGDYGITTLKHELIAKEALSHFHSPARSKYNVYSTLDFTYGTAQKLLFELVFAQDLEGDMKIEYVINEKIVGSYGGDVVTILRSYTSCPFHLVAGATLQLRVYTQSPLDLSKNKLAVYRLQELGF
jgi:FkbM family methyltransferase